MFGDDIILAVTTSYKTCRNLLNALDSYSAFFNLLKVNTTKSLIYFPKSTSFQTRHKIYNLFNMKEVTWHMKYLSTFINSLSFQDKLINKVVYKI